MNTDTSADCNVDSLLPHDLPGNWQLPNSDCWLCRHTFLGQSFLSRPRCATESNVLKDEAQFPTTRLLGLLWRLLPAKKESECISTVIWNKPHWANKKGKTNLKILVTINLSPLPVPRPITWDVSLPHWLGQSYPGQADPCGLTTLLGQKIGLVVADYKKT